MPELEDIFGAVTPPAGEQTPQTESTPSAEQEAPATPQPQAPTPPAPSTPAGPQLGTGVAAASPSLPAGLLQRAQAAGLKLDGIDSHDKFAEFVLGQYEQTRPYADIGRQSLATPTTQVRGQQEAAHEDGHQASEEWQEGFDVEGHFNSLWKVPQLDAASQFAIQNGLVQLGENGLYEAVPGYEAMALPLLNNLNQQHVAMKQQMNDLFSGNFYQKSFSAYQPAIEHLIQQHVNSLLQERLQERDQVSFVDQFAEQNKGWLYQPDGQTLTAEGVKFRDKVAELRSQGINDPQVLAKYAMALAGINSAPQPAAAAPGVPAAEKPRDGQGRFIAAGTPQPVEPPKTKQESFIEAARRQAAGSPSVQGGYAESGEFQVANEGELENIWDQAWRKHKGAAA